MGRADGAASGSPSSHQAWCKPGCSSQGAHHGKQPRLQAKRSLQNEEEEVGSDSSRTGSYLALSHALLRCVPAWPDRITHQTCNVYGIVGSKQKEAATSSSCLCHCCPQGERGGAGE